MSATTEEPVGLVDVLLVDDHAVFADALVLALASWSRAGSIRSARGLAEGRAAVASQRPSLLLVDVMLGDGDGIDLLAELADLGGGGSLAVVLTAHPGPAVAARAYAAGAAAVLAKDTPLADLVDVLDRVVTGRPLAVERVARAEPDPLSRREAEVLQLLAEGSDVRGVARSLAISPHTVRDHVKSAREKLGVHSQLDAVLAAYRRGLIELGR